MFENDVLYQKQGVDKHASYMTDFLNIINRYNDWTFEYVPIHFEEVYDALSDGRIDIMPFCGRGIDEAGKFLFSDVPSAVGSVALASPREPDMKRLRIAITNNAPNDMLSQIKNYAGHQGFRYTLLRFENHDQVIKAVEEGTADVMATIDFGLPRHFKVIASIAPVFFYITAAQHNRELFNEVNEALSLIFNLTPDFLNMLRLRYVPMADEGVFSLTYREQQYLEAVPVVRIAIPENQPPYCFYEAGKYTGIILNQVREIFSSSYLQYSFVPVKSYKEAVDSVIAGKADVIYSIANNFNESDSQHLKVSNGMFQQKNVLVTSKEGFKKGKCTFIGVAAYQYSAEYIQSKCDPVRFEWCNSSTECIEKVRHTPNSFTILPSMEVKVYEQSHLFPDIEIVDDNCYTNTLCIGISRRIQPELCSIIDKTIHRLSLNSMENYIEENVAMGTGLQAVIKQHPFFFISVAVVILFLLTIAIFLTVYNSTKRHKDKQIANAMNLANRDSMTGLYNHIAYEKLVNKTLEHQTVQSSSALVMIDIDNFKNVNDTLGHTVGDLVIVTVANTILSTFRQGDLKCRMGGDEFSVFMKDVADRQGLDNKLAFFLHEIERTFTSLALTVPVTCSVGAVICRGSFTDGFKDLYVKADDALYSVKESGKNSFAVAAEEVRGEEMAKGAEAEHRTQSH